MSSKSATTGMFLGSYPSPGVPEDLSLPDPLRGERRFRIRIPEGKTSGDKTTIEVGQGKSAKLTIPQGHDGPLQTGETFLYVRKAETAKVIASTLPSVPGYEVVQSKPIIWSTLSQPAMGTTVGEVMQKVHDGLLKEVITTGCNAVLGINFSISNETNGSFKAITVTGYGTPCILMKAAQMPIVVDEPYPTNSLPKWTGAAAAPVVATPAPPAPAPAPVAPPPVPPPAPVPAPAPVPPPAPAVPAVEKPPITVVEENE